MKLFWIIFLSIIVFANGYSKIINGEEMEKEHEDIAQLLRDKLEASPLPIQFIFVLRTNSPNYEQQLQLYRFIHCSLPSLNNNKTLSTNVFLLSPSGSMRYPLKFFVQGSCSSLFSFPKDGSLLFPLPFERFTIESKTSLCNDLLKVVDYLFTHNITRWEVTAKNFVLFNFNSNDFDTCQDKYEKYMVERGLPTVGTFLNVIHVNSTIIPEKQHVDFKDDQRFFLGYQVIINSSNDLDHYQKYYTIFRYFTKQMIQSSLNFTNNYFKYSSNDSFIHLNQEYSSENPEHEKSSDGSSIVATAFLILSIQLFIYSMIFLVMGVLFTADIASDMVTENINYQIEIIRTASILNPQPTSPPAEPVTSDPKLAPQPVLERSFSSVIWCDNLFTADGSNSSIDMSEMELDETQSVTNFAPSISNSSNV